MGFATTTIDFCPTCCNRCAFTSADVVLSDVLSICPPGCLMDLMGTSFEITIGDINGGYTLTGSSGNVDLQIPNFFTVNQYGTTDCTGDAIEQTYNLDISIRCFEDSDKPLGFFLGISGVAPVYTIFDIGITDPMLRFNFGEEVTLPAPCGGTLLVTP